MPFLNKIKAAIKDKDKLLDFYEKAYGDKDYAKELVEAKKKECEFSDWLKSNEKNDSLLSEYKTYNDKTKKLKTKPKTFRQWMKDAWEVVKAGEACGVRKVTSGWSYAVGDLWVSLVGNKPFNVDTMKDIHNIWVDIESDDGKGSAAPQVGEHKSSGPLTYQQEKLGKKREVVIHLRVPDGHQDAFYKAVRDQLKKDFKVTKLKSWKTPQTQG